ncbi:hypothetical protein Q2X41_001091 [Salmonella enterica]|nr:hypothetical protein [Salmonella enterica]ELM7446462.1 hypothetical protein [Salmonella enterica]
MSTNPLLDQSMLPYQAPRFDRIKDCHYRPAFDEGVRQKRVEIEAIVNHPTAPDFTNTLLALEQSGALLSRVTSIFFAMTAAHTNDELQRLDEAFSAELAALSNDIYLNSALFARVDAVWQQRHSLGLDDESLRLVDVIHQRFVLAGAQLAEEDKARLKVLNTESATLMSQFNQRLLAASKAGGLAVDDAHCLAGLSPEEMTVAAEAAREKGLEERWFIPLLNTTQQPALATLRDRQTRENLFAASWTRAEKGDAHDTRAIVQRLVEIRRCQAKLLGFPNYAAWKMADPRHVDSGEKMPADLQEKMRKASLFNKGYDMTELLGAALLDMRWHMLEESVAEQSVAEFEQQALAAEHLDLPAVPPRYRSSYFAHIFGGGYAAGYYAYLWTQMLADDGYQWFVEQGGLTRENGQRFRDVILSRGNSTDLETLYSAWRGHEPHIDPMLQYRGLDR